MLEVQPQEIPSFTAGFLTYSSDFIALPYLTDYDIDEQISQTIFSRYYSVSKFTSIKCNAHDFSTFIQTLEVFLFTVMTL